MERAEYFLNFKKYAEEIKRILKEHLSEFEVYVFGSVVRGDYSIGLSDIDIAVVSDELKDREKKLEIYDLLLEKFFETPFEFHLLTKEKWKFYLRFIKNDYVKI
ncbi:DNA polymerase beta domain protein region [Ferroglobus placidus DSM 10642]|uniref:DNA polymerase beta domain protein region n=1 Tax=Ferroglobus placidus (strain DSM 10642 / AEDII12DO) TaxID=589924 RepID=D3S244_FERPA|nr:nucleotidyltransferase domain-containing protein [Ferroglobus placidus]ADC66535.1 DNA polymerase beta domain protein region [Ferroglobus placidus DSM 10642]